MIPEVFSDLNIRQQYLEQALNETAKITGALKTPTSYLTHLDNNCTFTQSSLEELAE